MFDEATFEATIAKVNQAIDEFKNSKYYNLSPEAQKFISDLMAKADELREMIANEALWGNHQGQYPVENKSVLESGRFGEFGRQNQNQCHHRYDAGDI